MKCDGFRPDARYETESGCSRWTDILRNKGGSKQFEFYSSIKFQLYAQVTELI